MGVAWLFPAFAVALGSSYFSRLLAAIPRLAEAARRCPAFAHHCEALPGRARACAAKASPSGPQPVAADEDTTLRSAQFTCIHLATKVAGQVHAHGFLSFILTSLGPGGPRNARWAVSPAEAAEVELRCLEGLGWRLGPFFGDTDLEDDAATAARLASAATGVWIVAGGC